MARWTEGELELFQRRRARGAQKRSAPPAPPKRGSKYNNVKTERDGIVFDSGHEADRWRDLQLERRAGAITNLRRQQRFALTVNRMLICEYVADFVYERDRKEIVEDAKGMKTDVYKLKKKLMLACYGIVIQEV